MALKQIVKTLDEVPEALREYYVEVDGQFVLDTDDGMRSKLDEFRDNNRNLFNEKKKLEEQMAKFKDVDPAKYKDAVKAMEELEKLREQKLIDEGQLDEVVHQRTERMRADFEGRTQKLEEVINSLTGERDTFKTKLSDVMIDSTIAKAIADVATPKKGAMQDILARAKLLWQVGEDGSLVPMQGKQVVYGADGAKPLTPEEWGNSLFTEAPYLFEPNSGGGAGGGDRQSSSGVVSANDQDAVGANLEGIANGSVKVNMGD